MRARFVVTNPLSLRMTMTATVTDPDGNVVQAQPPPTPLIHEAYRFIRMSRTSDDLYDSYRNLFLAFECLLSDIRPPQRVHDADASSRDVETPTARPNGNG